MDGKINYKECAKSVFRTEREQLAVVEAALGDEISTAVEMIYDCKGKVVITGIGKTGIVGKKIACSLASTGTNAIFVNAAEAQHGDLGMVCRKDVIIAVSNSGNTQEILGILPVFKKMECPLIALTGNVCSPLGAAADVVLNTRVDTEACPLGLAPTSSTTAALVMGDALMVCLIERRQFKAENFALYHPGGALGRRLLTQVKSVMRSGNLPAVRKEALFKDIIYSVSSGRLGLTIVEDAAGSTIGIITDGDIRRAISRFGRDVMDAAAAECMTSAFKTIGKESMINDALEMMERYKIMALIVTSQDGSRTEGIVCMHDIIEMRR